MREAEPGQRGDSQLGTGDSQLDVTMNNKTATTYVASTMNQGQDEALCPTPLVFTVVLRKRHQ